MRKINVFMAAALTLLVGISSCSQDNNDLGSNEGDGVTGNLTINLGFEDIVKTRAAQSTGVIPVTWWEKNIKSMTLLLTEGGTIRRVLTIPRQNTNDFTQITRTFNGLPATTYEAYIIANYDQTATPFGTGEVTAIPSISSSSLLGADITSLELDVKSVIPADLDGGIETKIVGEPSEIFLAKATGIKVEPDVTTTFGTALQLKRAVSLLRVRLNQQYDNSTSANVDNSTIDFVNGTIRLRRHGTGIFVATGANSMVKPYGIKGITTTSAATTNVFYSPKKFKTGGEFVSANYKGGADMGIAAADFTLWNEYLILPGGNSATGTAGSGATKFNVVLSGVTTTSSYIPADRTTPVAMGTRLYWPGQVTGEVGPNQILELNISPKSAGFTTLPEVDEFGNLTITVNLLEWENTVYVNLPI